MKQITGALVSGLIFGIGLTISGMINPAKVLGFLDFAGDWDPTLALVMLGAILAAAPGYAVARRARAPLAEPEFQVPDSSDITPSLLIGAVLFGAGWGLVGFCPGPALAAIGSGLRDVYIFVAAMVAGMVLHRLTRAG